MITAALRDHPCSRLYHTEDAIRYWVADSSITQLYAFLWYNPRNWIAVLALKPRRLCSY